MTNKESAMKKVQAYSFALVEATHYLNGHPMDKRAIKYYNDMKAAYESAVEEYEKSFGHLTLDSKHITENNMWQWVKHPWPWQN